MKFTSRIGALRVHTSDSINEPHESLKCYVRSQVQRKHPLVTLTKQDLKLIFLNNRNRTNPHGLLLAALDMNYAKAPHSERVKEK